MSEAKVFFDELMAIDYRMDEESLSVEYETKDNVQYRTYSFYDGSQLVIGGNGYVSVESKVR